MTVPMLCKVLNGAGFHPNYGGQYEGGRGSYRMLSWFYKYYNRPEHQDVAKAIAEAFKKPNGAYAYE